MKSLSITVCAILITLSLCKGQTNGNVKANVISFELGKTGLIYSLTFDHKPAQNNFGFRLGAGTNLAKYLKAFSVGGGGYYLVGRTKHFLELGVDMQYLIVDEVSDDQKGFAFVYPDYSSKTFCPSINLGYRVYSRWTLFRIGLSPGLIDNSFVPGGYISYGLKL